MATTSTRDTTAWTTRRVRDRRVVAGGAWLTIAIIPSNEQFEHRLGPDGSVKLGRLFGHVIGYGPGDEGRTGHPNRVQPWWKSVPWVSCPVTLCSPTFGQWGTRSPARTARTTSRMASKTSSGCSSWMLWPLWVITC